MEFSGEEQFPISQTELWAKLTDMSFIARHLPGVGKIDKTDDRVAVCRVKPSFSFIAAPLKLTVERLEEEPPNRARMRVQGNGIGASLSIDTQMDLSSENGGSKVSWRGEVTQIGGLLKAVSKGLLEGAARKVIAEGWSNIRRDLEQPANSA